MKARPPVIIATVEMVLAVLAGLVSLFAFFFAFIASDYMIMPYLEMQYESAGRALGSLWSYGALALSLWLAAEPFSRIFTVNGITS